MIQKGQNVYYHPAVKRLVEVNEHSKQITLSDQRFYQRDKNNFYPSVTYVLSYFPKSKFFENWVKDVGHNLDIILRKAADEGTMVHNAVEQYLKGEEVTWLDNNGNVKYPTEVWKMIVKFDDFWQSVNPELITSECFLFSDKYRFAGTADIVCKIEDKVWLIDIKTSNSLHKSFDLQTAAYAQAWNESHNISIEQRGILWLKSSKRKAKKGALQGDGWEIKESTNTVEQDFALFELAYKLFELENPELKPHTEVLPTVLKLSKNE